MTGPPNKLNVLQHSRFECANMWPDITKQIAPLNLQEMCASTWRDFCEISKQSFMTHFHQACLSLLLNLRPLCALEIRLHKIKPQKYLSCDGYKFTTKFHKIFSSVIFTTSCHSNSYFRLPIIQLEMKSGSQTETQI